MKRIYSKTAYTLIELVVSLALVGIVLLGIISINMVLNSNNQDYGQRYSVRSDTQTTLNHILNNASLAIGTGVPSDPNGHPEGGVLFGNGTESNGGLGNLDSNNVNSFCIHQDIPVPPQVASAGYNIDTATVNTTASAPPNYPNSRWLCYTWYPSGDANYPYQIRYCAMPFNDTLTSRGAASCSNGNVTTGTPIYLGTAYSNPAATIAFNTIVNGTGNATFLITLTNCLNNSDTTNCKPTGISLDPANNPEVQLSGNVSPAQESF